MQVVRFQLWVTGLVEEDYSKNAGEWACRAAESGSKEQQKTKEQMNWEEEARVKSQRCQGSGASLIHKVLVHMDIFLVLFVLLLSGFFFLFWGIFLSI